MKLYFAPGACSLAPHIALMEAGIKFESKQVNLKDKTLMDGSDFYKVNAKGYVPTIQLDNGEILSEAAVLLQYIGDQKPEKNLIPKAGTMERYHAQEMLNFIATELHKGVGALWKPVPEDYKKIIIGNFHKRLDLLETHFKSNDYALGINFSVADAYLFTILNWTNYLKLDISKWTAVTEFMKRMMARPAVKEAMIAEGILK